MSMVVRTNTMAMNANSALNKNNSTVAGNLQKLSTGFRINRAADDASGLAVSEKMKAQIKALDQAGKNAQDGASLIKTAEGYMGEIHDMLNRIVELAEKSANGTYETKTDGTAEGYGNAATDRQAIQDEVDQLTTEIDRIASTANFNQLKLLDGSLDTSTKVTKGDDTFDTTGLYGDASGGAVTDSTTTYFKKNDAYRAEDAAAAEAASQTYDVPEYIELTADEIEARTTAGEEEEVANNPNGKALTLQIGETSADADKLSVSIMSFKTADLFNGVGDATANKSEAAKTAGFTKADDATEGYQGMTLNVSNQEAASRVAESVRDVINKVSSQRATLGAMENRLDYTMNNLDTASQNITDANSRIRDTDMAKTMMQYTQGNTLTQAAQAMLAQANQAPSQVLQLLQ